MKPTPTQRSYAGWTAALIACGLVGLAFGVPESGGCGGGGMPAPDPYASNDPADAGGTASAPQAPADDGGPASISGAIATDPSQRTSTPISALALNVVLIWDLPSGDAYKMGQGTVSAGKFALAVPAAPPDGALADNAVAVAHLIAVPSTTTTPDGPLGTDGVDSLTQIALGTSGSSALIYKAGNSANYPWLSAFPSGFSCGKGQAPAPGARVAGDASIAGFAPMACAGITFTLSGFDPSAFTNWAPVKTLPASLLSTSVATPAPSNK